jgi:hypothetical protein
MHVLLKRICSCPKRSLDHALAPDRVFLARRVGEGWRSVSYVQALDDACAIEQALLDRRLSITRDPDM